MSSHQIDVIVDRNPVRGRFRATSGDNTKTISTTTATDADLAEFIFQAVISKFADDVRYEDCGIGFTSPDLSAAYYMHEGGDMVTIRSHTTE